MCELVRRVCGTRVRRAHQADKLELVRERPAHHNVVFAQHRALERSALRVNHRAAERAHFVANRELANHLAVCCVHACQTQKYTQQQQDEEEEKEERRKKKKEEKSNKRTLWTNLECDGRLGGECCAQRLKRAASIAQQTIWRAVHAWIAVQRIDAVRFHA